jgi:hypothetical protein
VHDLAVAADYKSTSSLLPEPNLRSQKCLQTELLNKSSCEGSAGKCGGKRNILKDHVKQQGRHMC